MNSFIKNIGYVIIGVFMPLLGIIGQQNLSLTDVITLAHGQSLSQKKVNNTFENKYWQYNSYKKMFLPKLEFNGTLPDFNVGLSKVVQPDGTVSFERTSQITSNASVSISQPIKWTGGNLFFSTDLIRLDWLGSSPYTSYRTSPFYIGVSQPLLKFNRFKWSQKIEPLVFEEAKRLSVEQSEDVSIEAVLLFFNVLQNRSNYEVAKLNKKNSDTLYQISKGRYSLGKIAENELLQIELTSLNAEKSLAQAILDVQVSEQALKTFLKLPYNQKLELTIDTNLPLQTLEVNKVVELAKQHRSEYIAYQRRLLESQRELDKVKKENSFNADLFAAYGVTQTAPTLDASYQNPLDQESVRLGVRVPIYNWGLSKSNIKQQQANTELIQNQIEQDKKNFEQDVFILASQFNIMAQQVVIAQKAMEVAKKRYEVSKQRYLIGKSDILTFNNSLQERNKAIEMYYQTIASYWQSFYTIRKLTHYDFVNNKLIEAPSFDGK